MVRFSLVSLIVAAALTCAAVASAQTGSGLLNVYLQVVNPSGIAHQPENFNLTVYGNNPSPSTFAGSRNGVAVSVGSGNYSVAATGNQYGYTASYSQGCTGTMIAGQQSLCVVTMSANTYTYPYPSPYPFPPYIAPLSCSANAQSVGLRQNVSFEARGGTGGAYNWQVPGRSYPNAGPVLTVSFDNSGSHLVTVTNATQTATCVIQVTNTYNPVITTPIYPGYPGYGTPVQVTSQIYPRLPNTGMEPVDALRLGIAVTLLGAVALLTAPYVRKAFAIATR